MSNAMKKVMTLNSMRKKFTIPESRLKTIQWFPGHMGRGLKDINKNLKNVDIVIEVHDARIPFTGRNHLLQQSVENIKPVILILNKRDLINRLYEKKIAEKLKDQNHIKKIIFTNCRDQFCKGIKLIVPTLQHLSDNMLRFHRSEVFNTSAMVVGVPNVGKSSVINALRTSHLGRGKATPVGPVAGVTRSVLNQIKVSEKPLIYLLDTPGISLPKIHNIETGMRLASCATLQDHLVGDINIADYILYHMNMNENYRYVDFFGLEEPTDDVVMLLSKAAIKRRYFQKHYDLATNSHKLFPNVSETAKTFIVAFRKGTFGSVMLDKDLLEPS